MKNANKKWITVVEYIDTETEMLITRSLTEREYNIIRQEIKYEENEEYRICRRINHCERSRQLTIWG